MRHKPNLQDIALDNLLNRAHKDTPLGHALYVVTGLGSLMSLKAWLADKSAVDTVQVNYRENGSLYNAWFPGMRNVDTSAATYVRFNGSRREYGLARCIVATPDYWLGYDASMHALLLYSVKALS